jgi:S1-C subfamily serine protease
MRHRLAILCAGVLASLLLAPTASAQRGGTDRPRTSGEGFNLPGKPPPLGVSSSFDPGTLPRIEGPRSDGGSRLPSEGEHPTSSGTGFVVADGRILTNNHVVDECGRMVVRNAAGTRYPARVDVVDRRRDLALMTVPASVGPSLTFRDNPPVQRGEDVVTYGFPLSGLLSSGPTLTTGDVSALSGLRDNPNNLQISAPVQPGNSGGPLLDSQANVIGVVVSKLNAARIAEMTGGDIPQNVNFAVKGTEALSFLRLNGVQPKVASSTGADKRHTEIGQIANVSTVHVLCYR